MSKSTEELFYGGTPKTGANATRALPFGFVPGSQAATALQHMREAMDRHGINPETGEGMEAEYYDALLEDE
ncbi:MAG: hypothetical protein AB1578_18160 [Thermodesulfobacteriota bacterium]